MTSDTESPRATGAADPHAPHVPTAEEFVAVQASPEFVELKRRLRRFVFPMAVAFLTWYLAYVLLGAYAHDLMATTVAGTVNVGLLLGLAQFVTTFLITGLYVRYANREIDPRATAIREQMEGTR